MSRWNHIDAVFDPERVESTPIHEMVVAAAMLDYAFPGSPIMDWPLETVKEQALWTFHGVRKS